MLYYACAQMHVVNVDSIYRLMSMFVCANTHTYSHTTCMRLHMNVACFFFYRPYFTLFRVINSHNSI